MPTHYWHCVVCGARTACTGDMYEFGVGRATCCSPDMKHGKRPIEFCSIDCFAELWTNMREGVSRIVWDASRPEGQREYPASRDWADRLVTVGLGPTR